MATVVWTDGAADGDWSTASNWTGGSGVPASGDTAVISTSSRAITAGLGQSAVTLAALKIGEGFTGSIGTASTWLDINCTLVQFNSGGSAHYLTGDMTTVEVNGGAAGDAILSFKNSGDTVIGTLRVLGGNGTLTVPNGAALTTLFQLGASAVTVAIADGVTGLTNGTVDSGTLDLGANLSGTLEVRGGQVTVTDGATIGTLQLEPGGVVFYNSSGAITTATIYGGVMDGTSNSNASVTVTNCSIFEGATIDVRTGIDNWIFTNGVVARGGIFYPPIGSTVTVA